MKRLLAELDAIREVVNIYPRKRGGKTERKQTVLTKTSKLQQRLVSILGIEKEKSSVLGGMVQKGVRYRCAKHPAGRSGNGT